MGGGINFILVHCLSISQTTWMPLALTTDWKDCVQIKLNSSYLESRAKIRVKSCPILYFFIFKAVLINLQTMAKDQSKLGRLGHWSLIMASNWTLECYFVVRLNGQYWEPYDLPYLLYGQCINGKWLTALTLAWFLIKSSTIEEQRLLVAINYNYNYR